MIERHITFDVRAERATDFEQFFRERYRPAMAEAPGFVGVELLREAASPARYQMVLRWRDADAATGWRTSAAHEALQPGLTALAATNEITAYDIVA